MIDIPQPLSVAWEPKPDITVYELAMLMPYLAGVARLYEACLPELGTAARHLKRLDLGGSVEVVEAQGLTN